MNASGYSNWSEAFGTNWDLNSSNSQAAPPGPGINFSEEKVLKALIITTSAIGCILCSLLLLLIAFRYRVKWKKQMILVLNILICDLLISCSGISFGVANLLEFQLKQQEIENNGLSETEKMLGRRFNCANRVSQRIWEVGTNANLFGLLLITVDHFIAVRWSLKHATLMRNRTTVICCCVAWLVAAILGFLPDMLISWQYHPLMDNWSTKGTTRYCYQMIIYHFPKGDGYFLSLNQPMHKDILFWIGTATVAIVFFVMISVYCYIAHVVVSVNRRKKNLNSNYQSTYRNLKGVGTTIVLVFFFLLLYLPNAVSNLYDLFGGKDLLSGIWRNSFTILLCCTGIIDVCIYVSRNSQIRQLFKKRSHAKRYLQQISKTVTKGVNTSRSGTTMSTRLSGTEM